MDARLIFNTGLNGNLKKQRSTKSLILEYIATHSNLCRNTNITVLSKAIVLTYGKDYKLTEGGVWQSFYQMIKNQMIYRYGSNRRARFVVNWLHVDIPPEILALAPDDERKMAEEYKKNTKKKTPEVKEQKDETTVEKETEKTTLTNEVVTTTEQLPVEKEVAAQQIATPTVEVPVAIEKDGKNISLTITLNINI